MDSERSCDTEDWSNDAENSAVHHRNKLHLNYFKYNNSNFSCIFDQTNAALVSSRNFEHKKSEDF